MLAGPGRPSKACNTCKTQKARCSGDSPICKRCLRLKRSCSYSSKEPKRQRTSWPPQFSGAPIQPSSSKSISALEASYLTRHCAAQVGRLSPSPSSTFPTSPAEEHYLGIPLPLVLELVEVYFSYVAHASLLLHKSMFLEGLVAGKACPHIVVSLCAVASNFYQDKNNEPTLKQHGFMTEWAERAGKLVFQEAENVSEDNIVTFWNLAFFWHSQGSWRRSYIHRANAAQAAHVLGLGVENPRTKDTLDVELGRRRFWAPYLMYCYYSDSFPEPRIGGNIRELALPWSEEDFEVGLSSGPKICLESGISNGGIYCELIKALIFWSSVNSLIKTPEFNNKRVSAIHALDDQISKWWSRLPSGFRLSPSSLADVPQKILPSIVQLHIIYHQCLCALHSSIVPLFCWSVGDDSRSLARQLSAQEAFENACSVSALIDAFLSTFATPGVVPPYAAYAAYCGCAIQIPFMWCSNASVRERTRANVRANIRIIHILAKYWKFASLLEIRVRHLHRFYEKNHITIEDEPKYIDPRKLTSFKVDAPQVRESILGNTQILWTNGGGYAKPGEENADLGIEEDSDFQAVVPAINTEGSRPNDLQNQASSPPPSLLQPPPASVEEETQQRMPTVLQPYYPMEVQTWDIFRPWSDPMWLDMFPSNDDFRFQEDEVSGTVYSNWWESSM